MMKSDLDKKDDDPEEVIHHSGWDHLIVASPEDVNYAITGLESQVVTLQLGVGDSCQGEAGTMMYLSKGMQQHVTCEGFCGRCCSGEDCWVVNFTNSGAANNNDGFVALTPNFPTAKVVPVNLSSPDVGGKLIAQQGAFMASYGDVLISSSVDCNFMRCCCAGLGLVRQKLEGTGTVFLSGTGTMVQRVLKEGETILVDTNSVMAFADSCKLDIRKAGGIVGMIGGGEGIFNTTLRGPGLVIMQSMNETIFREALVAQKIYRR